MIDHHGEPLVFTSTAYPLDKGDSCIAWNKAFEQAVVPYSSQIRRWRIEGG